jgi:beta-lactam-binding protein with PASTA domain
VSTRPAAGTDLSEGRTVEVVIGIAPVVGDYVGTDVHEAVRVAELDGHVVDLVVDGAGPAWGPVRRQDPEPGARQRVVTLQVTAMPAGIEGTG